MVEAKSEFQMVADLEYPLGMTEAAVSTLRLVADSHGATRTGNALAFLAHSLETHLTELRQQWEQALDKMREGSHG